MAIGSPQWMYKSGEAYELDQSLKFNDDDSASLTMKKMKKFMQTINLN